MRTDLLPAPIRWALKQRRAWRFNSMLRGVKTWSGMSVLDLGCGHDGRSFSDHADQTWRITGVDLYTPDMVAFKHPHYTYVQGNAADLSRFKDQSFDLAISVGMLEHIGIEDAYRKVCSELQRVARQYIIVVPYKWAWVEPHYGVPFFGALPTKVQIALINRFNLCGHGNREQFFRENFRWRSNAEYRRDFPGSRIRFLPVMDTIAIVKSAHAAAM